MSSEAISFYLQKHLNSGAFAFYYDFNHWSEDGGNYILTTGSGDYTTRTAYSGEVVGDWENFTGTASGSGSFRDSYIKIENVENENGELFRTQGGLGFTFLVSQEKVDNSCGTIFSNYAGLQTTTSGWEFGINNANKLYFKLQDAEAGGNPKNTIITLNDTPAAKNYYGVTLQGNEVFLGRYEPSSRSWSAVQAQFNAAYVRNNVDWYIGSGEYPYSGYMDKFAYFSEPIPFYDLGKIIEASFQTIETGIGAEYQTFSGDITGYSYYPSGVTGVIGITGVFSGVSQQTGSGQHLTGSGITGTVEEGEIYYVYYDTITGSGNLNPDNYQLIELYSGVVASETLEERITGFETGVTGFSGGIDVPLYTMDAITGILWTGSGAISLFDDPFTLLMNPGRSGLSGDFPNSYLKDTVSYLGQRSAAYNVINDITGDFMEIISNVEAGSVNLSAQYGFSDVIGAPTFYVDRSYRNEGNLLNIFSNGVFQTTGQIEYGAPDPTNTLAPNAPTISITSGNYALTGFALYPHNPYFSNTDAVIYDADQTGKRGRLDIFETGDYNDAPFAEISPQNTQIFFNGQKVYSGIDYIDDGGFFPTPEFTGMELTGSYIEAPAYSENAVTVNTGINLYALNNVTNNQGGSGFSGNNFIYYINGARLSRRDFVEYSSGVSLLTSGKNVMELPHETFYNITTLDKFV